MELERDFKTPKELLDFIFIECSDMTYKFDEKMSKLTIDNSPNFLLERILFAYVLLQEKFNIKITFLNLSRLKFVEMNEGVLDKMELISFYCINTDIKRLPQLPDSVLYLNLTRNQLIELPELPKNLKWLSCSQNNLSELPGLPETLVELWCSQNNIKELPKLPDGVKQLISDTRNFSK